MYSWQAVEAMNSVRTALMAVNRSSCMKFPLAAVAAALAFAATSPATAAIVTVNFDLVATDFPAGAPVDPVVGNFKVTYDDGTDIQQTANGLTVTGFSLNMPSFFAYAAQARKLSFGSSVAPGLFTVDDGQYGFSVVTLSNGDLVPGGRFAYSEVGSDRTRVGTFTVTPATTAAVPEPASWALMIAGFGLAGARLRRRVVTA